MNTITRLAILLILAFLTFCTPPGIENSEEIESYLHDDFGIAIPDEQHFYLFIPETGCSGCVEYAKQMDIENKYKGNTTIIYLTKHDAQAASWAHATGRYIGDIGRMSSRGLYLFGITIYETNAGRIVKSYEPDANDIETVFSETLLARPAAQ